MRKGMGRRAHSRAEAFEGNHHERDACAMHGRGGRGGHGHGRDRAARFPFGSDDGMMGGRGFGRGPGFGGGAGPRRGGGRRKRMFEQAELQALLLALIVEMPRHGYDLIRAIEGLSGGEYAPSPGVVYPALTYMEEAGVIATVGDEGSRKSYEATEAGKAQAAEEADKVEQLRQRLSALAEVRDRTDPAPVRRAVHALKTAIFNRLSGADADSELVFQIADALDEATRKIERMKP